jgi:hypothetical protein
MTRRRAALALLVLDVGLIVALLLAMVPTGLYGVDTTTYLAAGERLNAGHRLYELMPGDRPVFLNPPYWTTPLVSSPTIAVLWRPLAAFPGGFGTYLWWLASLAALLAALALLWPRRPLLTGATMLVLVMPTASQVAAANINSFVLLGLVLIWMAWVQQRDLRSGAIAGVIAAVKLTPMIAVWWLLVTGRPKAFAVAMLGILALFLVGLVGAGVQAHLDYLAMLRNPASMGIYPESLSGFVRSWGAPEDWARVAPWVTAVGGVIVVWLLRRHPDWSYAAAILTMILGSPAVSTTWFILLYAWIAPLAYPVGSSGSDPDAALILGGRRLVARRGGRDIAPPPQAD